MVLCGWAWGAVAAAFPDAPPPAHSGAFGEPHCGQCHASYPPLDQSEQLRLIGLPDALRGGAEYVLTVELARSAIAKGGFQLSVRSAQGLQAGALRAVDRAVAIKVVDGVQYASHSVTGTAPSDGVLRWRLRWRAPAQGGPLRFNVVAVAGNNDASEFEDYVLTGVWHLGQGK